MASWNNREITDEHLLPYITPETAPNEETKTALNTLPFQRNVFKLLANAPIFFPTFMKLLSTCWSADRKLRTSDWQLIVLRTAGTLDAPYEFDVNEPVARILGFTDEQVDALKDASKPLPKELFTARQLLLAKFIEEINGPKNRVSQETLSETKKVFGDEATTEIFYTNGVYAFLARFMNSARIDFDPPIPGLEDMLRKFNAAAIEKEKTYTD